MSTMKLEKVTDRRDRWYDDACGTAHALELVGERWSLLIVRELMFGPRRFGALRAGLPGISAKVLAERLESLIAAGVAKRVSLPAPASTQAYALTPWGLEAEPVFTALGRWAARSPDHDPSLPLSAASLMLSFRTMFDAGRAEGFRAALGFRFGDDGFVVEVGPQGLTARRADPDAADVQVEGAPEAVAAAVYGGLPFEETERTGLLRFAGDREVFARFAPLFPLPAKASPS